MSEGTRSSSGTIFPALTRSEVLESFLSSSGQADTFLTAVGTAAAHVADAVRTSAGATTGATFAQLFASLSSLPVCPEEPVGLDQVMREVRERLLAHATFVSHPNYAAHLHCPPAIPALAAEVMISATNQSLDSYDQSPSATALECHVVKWMLDAVGFGAAGDAVFTSGATESNLMGLLMARDHHADAVLGWPIGRKGLPPEAALWRIVCSPQTHFSVDQALSLLGLGDQAVLHVECQADGALDPHALGRRLDLSRRRGEQPIAVVLTAGTTDAGSVDPLTDAIAIARKHALWVHVDAAAGGALLLSDRHHDVLDGLADADSVAIDFHKLLFQPISCGLFLVRDRASFELMRRHVDYLNPMSDEMSGTPNLVRKSLQTSRRFDALKVFMTMRALGRNILAQLIDATIDSARAAAAHVDRYPDLRLVVTPATNTVVLRWDDSVGTPRRIEAINRQIHRALREDGRALVGRTSFGDGTVLKLTFVNPLCTERHAERLVADVAAYGRRSAVQFDSAKGSGV